MRVLILSHVYADPEFRGKLRALAGRGIEVLTAVPGGTAGLDGGIRIISIPATGDPDDPGRLRWDPRAIRRTLSDLRPALVQIEEAPDSPAAHHTADAAHRLRMPYIVAGAEGMPRRMGLMDRYRYRRTLGRAAGIIGGSSLALALLQRAAPAARAAVVPLHGVSYGAETPWDEAVRPGIRLGFVGRLVPERGGEMLLRGLAQLFGQWSLSIVGTGPAQEPLEDLAQRLGLASRIRWHGGIPRQALRDLWETIDCLVVPSYETASWVEQSQSVLLEAMSRGLPVIVTRSGVLPEVVGDAGMVVQDEASLAGAVQQLMTDLRFRRALGEKARQRVLDTFVDAAIANRTISFWREVTEPT